MDALTEPHIAKLKLALLELDSSGERGFEGLLAALLSEICGQPFRVASAGSQRGRDGDSAFDAGATYFEAKLYAGDVPPNTVAKKLLEISIDDQGQVDAWILGTTSSIVSQHEEFYRDALARWGIGYLALDWPENTLPPLAVLLAMAPRTTSQFLEKNLTGSAVLDTVRLALEAIGSDSQFPDISGGLRNLLRMPSLGLGIAKASNRSWLERAFSSRRQAHYSFGQPLAPFEPLGLSGIERTALKLKLVDAFAGKPDDAVIVVLGDEGVGKSWLVAQTWQTSSPSSILVLFTADEINFSEGLQDIGSAIIAKLLVQVGDERGEASSQRWKRRFRAWKANVEPLNVRITVWIDGLNQAGDRPWAKWIDAAAEFLESVGGRLVVTTRAVHFAERLRMNVRSKIRRVLVEEWTDEELKSLLKGRGIDSDRLSVDVFTSLQNPRILGIAVELLAASEIERFEQLTVGRLLFEHLLRCERDGTAPISAMEFAKALRGHAETIIERLSRKSYDDVGVLDVGLDKRLKAVASSRFFEPVPGDPDLYSICDDGLPLALGISIYNTLTAEHRNGRNPADRIAGILEPIQSLERTAEITSAAVLVACLDRDCPTQVAASLLRHYIGLQNLPEAAREEFHALAKRAPEAFLLAAHDAALSAGHVPQLDWITDALVSAREDADIWRLMSQHIARWLSYCSLVPDESLLAHIAKEKLENERESRQSDIDRKVEALSQSERQLLEIHLVRRDQGDLSDLHILAFTLLAGMPLAPFAEALTHWSFANALNPTLHSRYKEFATLVTWNAVDWSEAREALKATTADLGSPETSVAGQWALVSVLRATGELQDGKRAQEIADHLTRDREKPRSFRRVEMYCASDPCDPASQKPENIGKTASEYRAIDVTRVYQERSQTSEQLFLEMAKPGIARFEPEAAIAIYRELALNVLNREVLARRQGILALLPQSAILESSALARFLDSAQTSSSGNIDGKGSDRENWLIVQFSLFLALPHRSGDEQLDAIARCPSTPLLLSLMRAVSPASAEATESWLTIVSQPGNLQALRHVLGFLNFTESPLSEKSREMIGALVESKEATIRTQVLGIASQGRDENLINLVVESGWDAGVLAPESDHYEIWYGSAVLLAAAEAGLLGTKEALDRVSPALYGFAAGRLGQSAATIVAPRVDLAFRNAMGLGELPDIPEIEREISANDQDTTPPLLSLGREKKPASLEAFVERVNESPEDYDARQKRAWQLFDNARSRVTAAESRILLERLSVGGMMAIAGADSERSQEWTRLLIGADGVRLRHLHLFATELAWTLATKDPVKSAELFRRLSRTEPFVRYVVGPSKIPLAAKATWEHASIREVQLVCFERLDRAVSDDEIAMEVLAALSTGGEAIVAKYVDERLSAAEPPVIARALTVCGFMDTSTRSSLTLQSFAGSYGFVGQAQAAASYAYERNEWSRHWFSCMVAATDQIEFWRCSILFSKIVDGRYDLWRSMGENGTDVFRRFFPTIESQVLNRIERQRAARRATLFGDKVPNEALIPTVPV